MNRYRLAPAARDDLKRISHYIAVEMHGAQGAKRLRGRFLECFRQLARNPHLGQACPELGENLRISPVGRYVILYVPREDGIDIVQVLHGAQDLPAAVRTPPATP
ncbi:MAG TPA: type II toxin-antitoxin system RelE/ParE family toxin [Lacipirellulaceae bacterium]|jgi:toxin ParE1/3/4